MPVPLSQVSAVMIDSMVESLTSEYGHPIDRALATKALFVTFGGVLAKTEKEHEAEVKKMFAELEKAPA